MPMRVRCFEGTWDALPQLLAAIGKQRIVDGILPAVLHFLDTIGAYEEIPGDPQEAGGSQAANANGDAVYVPISRPIWDWTKMRHQIEAIVYGYIEKNYKDEPRLIDTLPAGMLEKWRKIEKLGGSPTFRKRRHWGLEDMGPADPLPMMEAPPTAPRKSSDTSQRTYSYHSKHST